MKKSRWALLYCMFLFLGLGWQLTRSTEVLALVPPQPPTEASPVPGDPTLAAADEMDTPPTETPQVIPTPASPITFYLPLIVSAPPDQPVYSESFLACDSQAEPISIPDNAPGGATSQIVFGDPRFIQDLDVYLDVSHTWVGDLVIDLVHLDTGKRINLLNRPGLPQLDQGCGNNDILTILGDDISAQVQNQCASSPAAISGIYIPNEQLGTFGGETIAGTWTLQVSDHSNNDTGQINHWCIKATVAERWSAPLPPPPAPNIPPQAILVAIPGKHQALPLDCEARVAVDWAAYFGVSIDELEFFSNLPVSDNPDLGFVGDVYGSWGQIPPQPYGVHAEPVAALLKNYGLPAFAHRPLSWDGLRLEIASGHPVYVWVVGSVYNGIPVYYTSADGHLTIVAKKEHVVNVIGYSESNVTIQDGANIYTRSIDQFLSSWSALGNMAITTKP